MDNLLAQFNVIPCDGKRPLVSWGEFTERRVTETERESWSRQYPRSDYGIICGPISRLFVLDVDGSEGENSLSGYVLPRTVSVKTPHGRHYYFRWVPELDEKVTTRTDIIPNKRDGTKTGGVDVRGEGGFVRFYGWERGPHVAPLLAPPQWLIDLLPNKKGSRVVAGNNDFKKLDYIDAMKNLKEGNRNDTFARLAGGLRAKGFELKEVYEFLLPKAKEIGFDALELQTVCESICRYPAGARPGLPAEPILPETFIEFLRDEQSVNFVVPGILAKSSIAFLAGLPETCKTWTLMDLAIELARPSEGRWMDQYPVKHAKVLYIDQERAKSETQRRFRALITAKGLTPTELNDSLVLKCGTTIRMNNAASFASFRNMLADVKPDIVLVDSYKTFHTHDINSHVQMQEVMERVKSLKNEFGCTFVFIYHESKSAHERVGSDGKKKAISFEYMAGAGVMSEVAETILITVKQDQDSSFLHHVKNTYGQKVAPTLVNVENVTPDRKAIRVVAR